MLFMDISFDMIVYTLIEIFHSDLQQIRMFTVFHAFSFLRMSQVPVPVQELGIRNSKSSGIFKSPFMLLMIVSNAGNKLFLCANRFPAKIVQQNIVKIKGHNCTGVIPGPVPINLGAKKCTMLPYLLIKLKD